MRGETLLDPRGVIAIVGRDAQLRVVAQGDREPIKRLARDDAAFLVTLFRPRIGMKDEGASETPWCERRDEQPRVVDEKTHVLQFAPPYLAEQMRDAGLEDLAAHEAAIAMRRSLKGEM